MSLKLLVIDDSILFRRLLSDALTACGGVEIVGTCANGRSGLEKIRELNPDLVTLDIEMPGMSGLQVLDEIKQQQINCGVIVVSALTRSGGRLTVQALSKGAFDFLTKPEGDSIDENRAKLVRSLKPLLKAFARRLEIRSILSTSNNHSAKPEINRPTAPQTFVNAPVDLESINRRMTRLQNVADIEMVLIGVSTGGPNALAAILEKLPADLGLPVLIVQHMPPLFTQPLAESLDSHCPLKVKEAENGERLAFNTVYIAPGGRQMRLKATSDAKKAIEITDDPPENNCRPSVDYLFRSVAHQFSGRALVVILTGMGNDGLQGVKLLKRHNCPVITQDEASCVVYGMPRAVVEAGLSDVILPLEIIASKIVSLVKGNQK